MCYKLSRGNVYVPKIRIMDLFSWYSGKRCRRRVGQLLLQQAFISTGAYQERAKGNISCRI
ncbi:MAG: hypothetical protein JWN76_1566 [Chitinophagaceae bacterium]|nr:hypothetical protein [Chitinophagaceae bacterium]